MAAAEFRRIGRYVLADEIASGGIATVHVGRLLGGGGFSRTVAIKRIRPHFALPELSRSLIEEARLAARIRHPNVVATIDVVEEDEEVILVMEYVHGESLSRLLVEARTNGERPPSQVAVGIVIGALHGLQAAHDAEGEDGMRLGLIHRDVSPQNLIVGTDGITRVGDFGVAKAAGRAPTTNAGQVKGKLAYMAPEQVLADELTPRTDVFAAGIVLWEALTGKRLLDASHPHATVAKVLHGDFVAPSTLAPDLSPALDAVVMRALARKPEDRWPSALAFAGALEDACVSAPAATPREIGAWVVAMRGGALAERAARLAIIERAVSLQFPSDPGMRTATPAAMTLSVPRVPVQQDASGQDASAQDASAQDASAQDASAKDASAKDASPSRQRSGHARASRSMVVVVGGGLALLTALVAGARSGCQPRLAASAALAPALPGDVAAPLSPGPTKPLKDAHFEE